MVLIIPVLAGLAAKIGLGGGLASAGSGGLFGSILGKLDTISTVANVADKVEEKISDKKSQSTDDLPRS